VSNVDNLAGLTGAPPSASDIEYERRAHHARRVAEELDRLRVLEEARRMLDRERRGAVPPFDAGLLEDLLARPAEPPMRVDGFLPSAGRLLVVAQRKTGKTTFELNLGHSLLDGRQFLGRFATRPVTGTVAIFNYEVSAAMLAGWAQQVGIPGDRLLLVNLRGRRNPLDHPDDRARLVALLRAHQVEVLIVDPFGRAYTGRSQNDAGEVTAWLCDLDRFAADAGVSEVVLSVHAGWDGERTRGSSALEDWADVVVTLARDPDDEAVRYLRAFGRDVEIDEDRLVYEPDTRTLTLAGAGSRKHNKAERAAKAAMPDVLNYVADNPSCSDRNIRENLDGTNSVLDQARRRLVERGDIVEEPRAGRGGGKSYRVPAQGEVRPSAPNRAAAQLGTAPTASIKGAVPEGALPAEVRRDPGTARERADGPPTL
jgi:AAA domain